MVFSSIKEKVSTWNKPAIIASFKNLYPLIWPLFVSLLTRRFLAPISVSFAGRVGIKELSAVGISFALLTATATGIGGGLAIGFEAMAARSYGERKYHDVGVLLQKAFIFALFLCVVVFAVWIHSGIILAMIGIPHDIAALTEKYLLIYIPAALGIFVFRLQRGYLIVLRNVIPVFCISVLGVVLLVPINFLFMDVFHAGVEGVAISNDITNALEVLAIFLYILISGVYKETWPGLTKKCFLDWKTYLTFTVPGALTFLLKSMVHEIALLSVGSLGEIPVAAQTALFTLNRAISTIGLSVGIPTNVNISKHFGEGKPNEAKTTAIVGFLLNVSVSVIIAVCLLASKDVIGKIFTKDVEVIGLISELVPYATLSFLLETTTTVMFIMCVGLHLQTHSMIVYGISCYVIALPLGITLALYFKDITLLWWGLIVGFLVQLLLFAALFWWKADFDKISQEIKRKSTSKISQKTKTSEYTPVRTSDYSDREEVEITQDDEQEDTEFVNKDIESKKAISSEENMGFENEEVTSSLIMKRLVTFGTSVVILVISIIVKFCFK